MGGISSLGGLNKVSVDFRPAIDANAPDNANANQPQHAAAAEEAAVRDEEDAQFRRFGMNGPGFMSV